MSSISSTVLRGLIKNKMDRISKDIAEAKTTKKRVETYREGLAMPIGSLVLGKYSITERKLGERDSTWIGCDIFPGPRLILFLHGGGYIGGSTLYTRNGAASLALASGCRLVSLEYRLAPEYAFPAALDDAVAAYRALLAEGIPPEGIALVGESAGGGLALAATLAIRDRKLPMPAAVVALSPWCDLTLSNITIRANRERDIMLTPEFLELAARIYTGKQDRTNPYISPLFGSFEQFSPLLLQVAAEELLLGECIALADKAASQSDSTVELEIYEGVWHVWQTMNEIVPEAQQAMEKIGHFIRKHTGAPEEDA